VNADLLDLIFERLKNASFGELRLVVTALADELTYRGCPEAPGLLRDASRRIGAFQTELRERNLAG
jgi:hypothetical protein